MNQVRMNLAASHTFVIKCYGFRKHHVNSDQMKIPSQSLCEELLKINHTDEVIGPAVLQLFGLAYFDDQQKTCIWINPRKSLSDTSPDWSGEKITLHLRMRFVPLKDKISSTLLLKPNDQRPCNNTFTNYLVKYLYYQVKDDFITGRLEQYFDKSVLSSKARGIAVLDLLLLARLKNLPYPEKIFDHLDEDSDCEQSGELCPKLMKLRLPRQNFSLKKILPKKERKNFWKDYKLKNNMKTKLTDYSREYEQDKVSCQDLMAQYIKEIMADVTEKYNAKDEQDTMLEITINIPDGCILFIREKSDRSVQRNVCTISELRSTNIQKLSAGHNKFVWVVHVHRTNGKPLYLKFESSEIAESFVSGLDGYYRLIHHYYFSLCDNDLVEPPSLKMLNQIRSHGPIEDSYAAKKLKMYSHEYYLIKQDIYTPDKFSVVYSDQGQIRIRQIVKNDSGYFVEGLDDCCCQDMKGLLCKFIKDGNIPHQNPFRVKPKLECCDILKNLFVSKASGSNTDDDDSAVTRKRQPFVYLPSDLIPLREMEIEKLGNGYFTEVCKRRVKGMDSMVAVKQVRKHHPDLRYQEDRCYESLQDGVCQQLGIDDVRFFVNVYGICLTSPPKVIEEYAQFGSLSKFFTSGKPVTLQHLQFIALQLAEALLYMDEKNVHHGNICCGNIMVFQYDSGNIGIKLADRGMLQIYNKLPLTHILNTQRIPWLAPELFSDLTKTTISSDIYAFSTTLWECATLGSSPLWNPSLRDFQNDSNKLKEFFEKDNRIEFPPELEVKDLENIRRDGYNELDIETVERTNTMKKTIKRVMTECWYPVDKRMETSTILRELRADLTGYTSSSDTPYWYTQIQYLDQTSLSGAEHGQTSHNTTSEIPNVMEHIGGGASLGGHIPAERLTVNIPPIQPTDRGTNSRKLVTDMNRVQPDAKSLIGLQFLIDSSRIRLQDEVLGKGHYGEVRLGTLYNSADNKPDKIVAKTLKESQYKSVLESEEFQKEGLIMSQLKHENIVRFIGISDNKLIMEWVEMGCMRDYLKKSKNKKKLLSICELLDICKDIATGMGYLASERILHCDLAARNVLLTSKLRAKISDFGLSKILDKDKDYYRRSSNKSLPAWWCSPEALKYRKFTHKADVWSFGVVMWEAFTHCDSPRICNEATHILETMEKGKRLQQPKECPDKVYQLMRDCWEFNEANRPDFPTVEKRCSELVYIQKETQRKQEVTSNSQNETGLGQSRSKEQKDTTKGDNSSETSVQNDKTMEEKSSIKEGKSLHIQGETTPELISVTTAQAKSLPVRTNEGPLTQMEANCSSKIQSLGPLPPVPIDYLLDKKTIKYSSEDRLGDGNFGQVFKGRWKNKDGEVIDVAIKKFKEDSNDIETEVNILVKLSHPGIVKLHGFCRTDVLMVMELVENGDLVKYLKTRQLEKNPVEQKQLMKFCLGIAQGMEYLAGMNIIHCDLAARNILLTKNLETKISDFGLSKILMEKTYYIRSASKSFNVSWCSPEFLKTRKLSIGSDIWSYGIVMWEIFSHGDDPNICQTGEVHMDKVAAFIQEKGCTLQRVEGCPDHVYSLMQDCWKQESKHRPKFSDLVKKFQSYLSNQEVH